MSIRGRGPVRRVDSIVTIAASGESVFDYVTDVEREPEWNPQLRAARKLTPGPIGATTRYRVRFGRGVGTAVIENTAFDRPRGWSAVSRSRRLEVRFRGQITEVPGGCRLAFHAEPCPRGGLRLLSPFLYRALQRSWDQDLRAIKAIIEAPSHGHALTA